MDTRLATTNIRIQQWTAVFKAKAESGLTVDEYCDQNGITRNAYYYWLRRARTAALENIQTNFVELKVPKTEAFPQAPTVTHSFIPQLIIEKNGLVIGIDSNTPKELLALALEAAYYVE
jgi:transposase-like protein